MKFRQIVHAMLACLLLALASSDAFADSGIVRLRDTRGSFIITIFTASEATQGSLTDVSVMVQRSDSGDLVLNALVDLIFIAPPSSLGGPNEEICGEPKMKLPGLTLVSHSIDFTVAATRDLASNKLLYAAPVRFGVAGNWRLQALVRAGGENVSLTCHIPVGLPPRSLAGLTPYLALPPMLIALFAFNQWLRRHSLNQSAPAGGMNPI